MKWTGFINIYEMISDKISGKTGICGIIGDPIEHTVSPGMQNAAFQASGEDFIYLPFRVKREDLEKAVQGMRALNLRGLNVTIPHKVAVMPFLDEIDPLAEKIGAVNTILNKEGILKGYNTDASGFLDALLAERVDPSGKRIVILGSGGAARSIACSLAEKGATLFVLNRHPASAVDLADRIHRYWGKRIEALEMTENNLQNALAGADILVNTTSLGMIPKPELSPVPSGLIKPGTIVFDIVYNPLKTRLLRDAEKRGARIITGIEMLVRQGAAAFYLWTGKEAPLDIMKKVALEGVETNEETQEDQYSLDRFYGSG
jgi:shikimate dehydrogenase